jgi:hypothetical protein
MKHILRFLVISSFFIGCTSKEDGSALPSGRDYFPIKIGKPITYQVDSMVYTINGNATKIDTIRRLVQRIGRDSFEENGTKKIYYRIEELQKTNNKEDWQLKAVRLAANDATTAHWVEGNFRFIPLTFPLVVGTNWRSTALFPANTIVPVRGETIEMFKNWSSNVETIDKKEKIGTFDFEKVATITHAKSENKIELRQVTEKYAKGVGLVFREVKILDTQKTTDTRTWEQKAEKGFIVREIVVGY